MRSDDRREIAATRIGLLALTGLATAAVLIAACAPAADDADAAAGAESLSAADSCSVWSEYRGLLGDGSSKIRRDGDEVFVWAGGDESGPGAEWYDFTDAPMDPAELQYGLGRDRIRSIDVPIFVSPDDPRLMELPVSPYRRCERPQTAGDIMVIGYVAAGQPRAYPTALLDRHEVVNETANGKPFTVGW